MRSLVLVTGGAGYIGSVVTGQLLQAGYRVRVLDMLLHGGNSMLPFVQYPNFEFVRGDIRNSEDLSVALDSVEMIVHLAAIVGDPACARQPDLAETVNKEGSELLCDLAIQSGVRRFIFVSTCSNYGKMSDSDDFVDESSPLRPVSLYAELKVGFEKYLLEKTSTTFETVCLRFATAFGMSLRPRFDLTVNEFTRNLLCNRELEVYGEQFWRPYCHTIDLATACKLALEADSSIVNGQAFNIGATNQNLRKKDVVDLILKQLPGKARLVKRVERTEDPRDYRVNCDKVSKQLNFEITQTIPDGIKEIIQVVRSGLIQNPYDPIYRNLP